jgi:Bacterial SH3 domain
MKKDLINLTIVLFTLLAITLACNGLPGIQTQQSPPPASPSPAAAQTSTPDPEKALLAEKLSNLEKKIDDQQKPTVQPQVKPTVPVIRSSGSAWVNSPGDGFLALRSNPDSDVGYRILQIPHGANVRVLGCRGYSQRIGGRTGRWCRVSYGGSTGWAFDGWLVYY